MPPATPAVPACDVWWADPALASPALLGLLDEDERARHARFRLAADRDRYAVAHSLARLVCARAAGCAPRDVAFTLHCDHCDRPEPHGKPRPAGPAAGWEISITHSGSRVGVAVARGLPVGLDVERVAESRDLEGLASYALTGIERAALESRPEAERTGGFFTYWARKESLLKATGAGLSGGLTPITVSGPHESAAVLSWDPPGAPDEVWITDLDAGPDYRAALSVLAGGPVPVTEHDAADLLKSCR
ncbi:4'-phosphopantetheinyl transferase family protein [Actinorugispora endophytica]|uniref:4'-phosphopantetheinyl transferase family protein n=1 Tax=Actinorugispora endophytica TaxID=1605990 RepID=UPI00105E8783|nr:4'-phosphopantetheinyl transferase superfamily protein [Actinorugispora endophytica]